MGMPPELMVKFLEHHTELEKIIEEAIRAELKPLMDVISERLTQAQDDVETARKAMEAPQAAVKVIEDDITRAENQIAARVTYAGSDDMGDRVAARALIKEWQVEVEDLQDKRAEAVIELGKFEADYARTLNALDKAETDAAFMVLNLAMPFKWYGQSTDSFKMWLQWGGGTIDLHYRHEDHDAYDAAKAHLEELCHRNGVYPVKVSDDKVYKDMWDKMRDDANPAADPTTVHNAVAPNVVDDGKFKHWDSFDPIEDHRDPGLKDTILNPPPVKDDWRTVPMIDRESLKRP